MSFRDYIKSVGIEKFAKRHGLSVRSTTAYYYGQRRPKPEVAMRIIKDEARRARRSGHDPLTWEDIYGNQATA